MTLTATWNRTLYSTGLAARIIDADTGTTLASCSSGTSCSYSFSVPWSQNESPAARHFVAKIVHQSSGSVQQESPLMVPIRRYRFGIALAFSAPQSSGSSVIYTATATTGRSVTGTGYSIRIRRSDGTVVTSCSAGSTCTATLPAGASYRATVENAAGENATTPTYTLGPDEIVEEQLDDVDLVLLAGLYPSSDAICTAMVFYPHRTHLMEPPSSLSDQQRVCLAAVQEGKTAQAVLRALVAAGGAGVLHHLLREAEEPATDSGDPPPPPRKPPVPVPPPVLPLRDSLAKDLMDLNPDLTQYQADKLARNCQWRLAKLALNGRRECVRKRIFATGADVAEATEHDIEALAITPVHVKLTYVPGAARPFGRWASGRCPEQQPGQNCDEFPFYATAENGPESVPPTHLKAISGVDNQLQGSRFSTFRSVCNMSQGDEFWVIPLEPELNIPTLPICNGLG